MRCRSTTPSWTSRAGRSAQEESKHRLKDSKGKDRALVGGRSLSWASKAHQAQHQYRLEHRPDHSGASLLQGELRRTPLLRTLVNRPRLYSTLVSTYASASASMIYLAVG